MTFEELKDIISPEVTPDSKFRDYADSLELVQLCLELEDATGLDIPETDILQLSTVQQVLDYVNQRSQAS